MPTDRPGPFDHLRGRFSLVKPKPSVEEKTAAEIAELAAADLARQIIRAAAKARGEVVDGLQAIPQPVPVQATAEGIIRAVQTARSGGTPHPEPTGVVKAILEAGRKRRAEEN